MSEETKATPSNPVESMGLLSCPFCGGDARIERRGSGRQSSIIACEDCGCSLESNEVAWNTGTDWNARQPNDTDDSRKTRKD